MTGLVADLMAYTGALDHPVAALVTVVALGLIAAGVLAYATRRS